jgi:predicted metalloprotease
MRFRTTAGALALLVVAALAGCGAIVKTAPAATGGSADLVTRSLKDVERFWAGAYPAISGGRKFQPVSGGYHPYTKIVPPPACGDQPGVYEENAFFCPPGDFIAWDDQVLIPQLQAQFGPLLIGVVFAHEYGHSVQTQLGRMSNTPTVVLEQQADCFAGAWLADVMAGHSTAFPKPTAAQLDNTVAGLLMLRDQPGTSATGAQSHGNAFDRIRALQDGVVDGPKKCAGYSADNLPVTEVPFLDQKDAASGGNLPYDQALQQLTGDAQLYWTRTFPQLTGEKWTDLRVQAFDPKSPPACARPDLVAQGSAFYCPDGDFAAFDGKQLAPQLYSRIGDNAVGMLLGDLFARAVQDRRGVNTADRAGQLSVDCLAGTWTHDLLVRPNDPENLRLSSGDLDEAVSALLALGRVGEKSGTTAFDRIVAFRNGVLGGLGGCAS